MSVLTSCDILPFIKLHKSYGHLKMTSKCEKNRWKCSQYIYFLMIYIMNILSSVIHYIFYLILRINKFFGKVELLTELWAQLNEQEVYDLAWHRICSNKILHVSACSEVCSRCNQTVHWIPRLCSLESTSCFFNSLPDISCTFIFCTFLLYPFVTDFPSLSASVFTICVFSPLLGNMCCREKSAGPQK